MGAGNAVDAAPVATSTWDPSHALTSTNLSDGNRTVTRAVSNSAGNMVRGTKAISVPSYWEILINSVIATNDCGFGVCDSTAPVGLNGFANYIGGTSASVGVLLNGSLQPGGLGFGASFPAGTVALCAYNPTTKRFHIFLPGRGWNRAGDSALVESEGVDSAALGATVYPAATVDEFDGLSRVGDSITINTGNAPFVNGAAVAQAIAAGYTALG